MPYYAGDPIICFLTANLAPAVSGTAQEKTHHSLPQGVQDGKEGVFL